MVFTVRFECCGRLGNAIFPYILCVLYQMIGYKYVTDIQGNEFMINDNTFLEFFNDILFKNNTLIIIPSNIVFSGYFQHDFIIKYQKDAILNFINNNLGQKIPTELGIGRTFENTILINDYLPEVFPNKDDVIVHLRLEDRITDIIDQANYVISPFDYDSILEKNNFKNIYWVMNKPKLDIEKKYLKRMIDKWGGIYKERTIEEDVTLMRKAKNIICSRSTLSWISSAFSFESQNVYLPKCYATWNLESFTKVHDNTIIYDHTRCRLYDLETILEDIIL